MSRSRFEKLEGERSESADAPAADQSLDARFGAEPEAAAPAPDLAPAPEAHARFDADGGDGLGLDRDPLAELPMLQCAQCAAECGKFEQRCAQCGASMTSDAARAHNLTRVGTLRAQKALEQQAESEKRAAQIRDLAVDRIKMLDAQVGMAGELHEKFGGETRRPVSWVWLVAAVVCFGLARLVPWFGLRVLLISVGAVCAMTQLPRSAWAALARPARRRGGW